MIEVKVIYWYIYIHYLVNNEDILLLQLFYLKTIKKITIAILNAFLVVKYRIF